MTISFTPTFVRAYKNLTQQLQVEVKEKIALFEINPEHHHLKAHKLKGKLKGRYSFSVNYKYRIIFIYTSAMQAVLLMVGDHEIYQ